MKIGFIFTNYNNSHLSKAAIESILTEAKGIEIVVVDNNSNQNHLEILHEIELTYKNVYVIYNDHNVGYFPGLNIGINYIRMHCPNCQHLVIGNNDLIFPRDFLHNLRNKQALFFKYPVISPNIVTTNGIHQNPHVIKTISKYRELFYELYHLHPLLARVIAKLADFTKLISDRKDESSHNIPQEIYQGYGACYILGPIFFEHFDKLWAPTFLMYEEFFLSKQLLDKGFKIYYEPSICLTHMSRASTGELSSKQKWLYSHQSHKEYRKYIKIFSNKPLSKPNLLA